jgi:hypothetical protein
MKKVLFQIYLWLCLSLWIYSMCTLQTRINEDINDSFFYTAYIIIILIHTTILAGYYWLLRKERKMKVFYYLSALPLTFSGGILLLTCYGMITLQLTQ